MSGVLLDVGIPTWNRAEGLRTVIQSVLDQDVDDVRVHVSDNASTDHTAEVVAEFDERVVHRPNPENLGPYPNMSRALHLGDAPLLTVLHDDSPLLPGSLRPRLELLADDPSMGFVHSAVERRDHHADGRTQVHVQHTGGRSPTRHTGRETVARLLGGGYSMNYNSAVIRRSVLGDLGFDPDDGAPTDLGFALRLAARCEYVGYLPEPSVVASLSDEDVSMDLGLYSVVDGEYRLTFRAVREIQFVRRRFLDAHPDAVDDPAAVRAGLAAWGRQHLWRQVLDKVGPDGGPLRALAVLREAAAIEPSVLRSRRAVRYVAGRAARRVVRRNRGEGPREGRQAAH